MSQLPSGNITACSTASASHYKYGGDVRCNKRILIHDVPLYREKVQDIFLHKRYVGIVEGVSACTQR